MDQFNLSKLQDDIQSAISFVIDDIKQKFKQINDGPAILDSLQAFVAAVDWTVSRDSRNFSCSCVTRPVHLSY